MNLFNQILFIFLGKHKDKVYAYGEAPIDEISDKLHVTILLATDSGGSFLKKSTDSSIVSLVTTSCLFFGIFRKAASLLKSKVSIF